LAVFLKTIIHKERTFIFSVRKSYLNLIKGAIRLAAVPDYWDFNLKAVYHIDKNTKISLVGIGGLDKISFEGESPEISDDNPYGKAKGDQQQFTAGFNLKKLFKKGFWQTVLANSSAFLNYTNYDLRTDELVFKYDSYESDFNLKSEVFYQLNKSNNIIIGATARYIKFSNETFYAADTTAFGDPIPEANIDVKDNYYKASDSHSTH
jgi:hypothetical protein